MKLGANPLQLSWIQLNPYTNPSEKGFGTFALFSNHCANDYGLTVDPKTGKRFMNEHAGRKIKTEAIFKCMAESENNDNYPVNICDQAAVDKALADLKAGAADESVNLMPLILAAVKTYATLGEICNVLREVFGEYEAHSTL